MTSDDPTLTGKVVEFDAHVGLGRIQATSGENLLFHCAEISDGSRQIDVGQTVTFVVRSKFNNPEAFTVSPIPG
jgi:cold shock CspA family protein